MKSLLPKYFDSEVSLAQFRIKDTRAICAFGKDPNTLIVINPDGSYHVAGFDPEVGGACSLLESYQIMDLDIS